ncbi:MAG: class A beta-lactamase-related serine hydrolase [Pedosphaera sp.]|nr:class A beta-lactamase-related serine hydrolase [Pedosphaera sp.]
MIGSSALLAVGWIFLAVIVLLVPSCALRNQVPVPQPVRVTVQARSFRLETEGARSVEALLEPIRLANNVPAVACAVVRSNRLVGIGAVGFRRWGVTNEPVTLYDRWHHGSLTKSMTATLAAILVDEGRIRWDSTLAEVFPAQAAAMKPAWRAVTLDQLTANRGGGPTDLQSSGIWMALCNFSGPPTAARRLLLERLTTLPPSSEPGTRYEYSNAGFSIAGHMLETVMGEPWEELLTERVFLPLGITSGGFGPAATRGLTNQPWGHRMIDGNPEPIPPGAGADNPAAIGPAGTVHCNVLDLARYAAFHILGERRDSPILSKRSVQRLHTPLPNNNDYAHGWILLERPWGGAGRVLHHAGSNTQWYSVIWLAPARDFAVVAVCNLADAHEVNAGNKATDQIASRMIQEFLSSE